MRKVFFSPFSRFAKIISFTNVYDHMYIYNSQMYIYHMRHAGGGFTEYEWFDENLSICRYARSKSVRLDYFVICIHCLLNLYMVLFFAAAAVDYYVYYTVPCFFGLFLLALFLSPFGLELKYEVGVWMKLT